MVRSSIVSRMCHVGRTRSDSPARPLTLFEDDLISLVQDLNLVTEERVKYVDGDLRVVLRVGTSLCEQVIVEYQDAPRAQKAPAKNSVLKHVGGLVRAIDVNEVIR